MFPVTERQCYQFEHKIRSDWTARRTSKAGHAELEVTAGWLWFISRAGGPFEQSFARWPVTKESVGDPELKLKELAGEQTTPVEFPCSLTLMPTCALNSSLSLASQVLALLWWFCLKPHNKTSLSVGVYHVIVMCLIQGHWSKFKNFRISKSFRFTHWASLARLYLTLVWLDFWTYESLLKARSLKSFTPEDYPALLWCLAITDVFGTCPHAFCTYHAVYSHSLSCLGRHTFKDSQWTPETPDKTETYLYYVFPIHT